MHACMHACMHARMHDVRLFVCLFVCLFACLFVCLFVCLCVGQFSHVYVCVCVHVRIICSIHRCRLHIHPSHCFLCMRTQGFWKGGTSFSHFFQRYSTSCTSSHRCTVRRSRPPCTECIGSSTSVLTCTSYVHWQIVAACLNGCNLFSVFACVYVRGRRRGSSFSWDITNR